MNYELAHCASPYAPSSPLQALRPMPQALRSKPFALCPMLFAHYPKLSALRPNPSALRPLLLALTLLYAPFLLLAQEPSELSHPQIDQVYATFQEAYVQLDPQMIQDLYEEDAYYLYPNIPVQRGHEKFMGGFRDMFKRAKESQTELRMQFRIVDRQVIGDYVYDVGYYKLTRSNGGKTSVGKFVTILRKQADGQWKFVLDTYSSAPEEVFEQ